MNVERQVGTQRVFNGNIIGLRLDTIELPSGRQATREVVEHQGAVVVLPIDMDENVLLVRQYRYPVKEMVLEAPAGGIELGELPEHAAVRELGEEVGVYPKTIEQVGHFWSSPGFCTEVLYAFVARDLVPSQLVPDEDEVIEIENHPVSNLRAMIRSGDIQDAKTISVIQMAEIT